MTNANLMIVESDDKLAELLACGFSEKNFSVCLMRDGRDALKSFDLKRPDLVILDWVLPSLSGIEVCRRLRMSVGSRDVPIIMLAGRCEAADVVHCLSSGADDHLRKPFSMALLLAKVNAMLRRVALSQNRNALTFGDVQLDRESHRVTRGSRLIELGPKEYLILEFLLENPNRILSRRQILDAVWGYCSVYEERIVDVHVASLRKRLNKKATPDLISTVRGAGYMLT